MTQEQLLKRTVENTSLAEILKTVAPPREGTTGVHLVQAGDAYLFVIQGPDRLKITRCGLEFFEALYRHLSMDAE